MSTATVSEGLGTLSALDFEPEETPDDAVCEIANQGCDARATWRWVVRSDCPHDGTSYLFCDRHKSYAETWLSQMAYVVCVAGLCQGRTVMVKSWLWERL